MADPKPDAEASSSSASKTSTTPQVPIEGDEVATGSETDRNPTSPPMNLMGSRQRVVVVTYSIFFLLVPAAWFIELYSAGRIKDPSDLLLLTALLGAAMGSVHSLASIAIHAGRGNLGAPWVIFYICRPFTGVGIALVTSLVLMSGLGGFKVPYEENPLPLLAWASLAGLYSQPALDKLRELFDTLFRTRASDQEEKTQNPTGGDKS